MTSHELHHSNTNDKNHHLETGIISSTQTVLQTQVQEETTYQDLGFLSASEVGVLLCCLGFWSYVILFYQLPEWLGLQV